MADTIDCVTKIPIIIKKYFMYNEELLIINKPRFTETYFEMSMLYLFQLLIQKDERVNVYSCNNIQQYSKRYSKQCHNSST